MKPAARSIGSSDCPICGDPCTNGDKIVEVKYRLKSKAITGKSANWTKAHLGCAKNCRGEHERMEPRKIRSMKTKARIKPNKKVKPWATSKPERGLIDWNRSRESSE